MSTMVCRRSVSVILILSIVVILSFSSTGTADFVTVSAAVEQQYEKRTTSEDNDDRSSNSALVSVPSQDSDSETGDYSDVTEDKEYFEPFVPTHEWQSVKPGQAVPAGLHIRLNLETGEREAKLITPQYPDTDNERVERMKQELEKATLELENSRSIEDDSSEDLKYWKDGDREGMLHTNKRKFTPEELKEALKKFKVVRDDPQQPLTKEQSVKEKFRSIDDIRSEFKSLHLDMKTDLEILTELVTLYKSTSLSDEEKLNVLNELEYHLHQIDNAQNFVLLGGLQLVVNDLNPTSSDVRSTAAFVLGSALQSNPKVQIEAIQIGTMPQLLRLLVHDPSDQTRSRVLYALSSLVRHFPFAQHKFLQLGGLEALIELFKHPAVHKLQVKALTLVNDLLNEKRSILNDTLESQNTAKVRQYQNLPLMSTLIDLGWCSKVTSLLSLPGHDSREKVLNAMITLVDHCRNAFAQQTNQLQRLRTEYQLLANEELQTDDDNYFTGLLSTIDKMLQETARTKDEL